ncbi:EAL domain-containing protein [Methylomonas sp. LW13]|uniref:EAL domain-containing protein n=1 Tax=unclassified Methylomonas TaxID=2608980 RepID=UPI00069036B0|nr:EAL domain-containing protein [Methylomonas sp. LW13]QBC28362.1 EAL domain-containing protein [Methylomonas sp. LW13]
MPENTAPNSPQTSTNTDLPSCNRCRDLEELDFDFSFAYQPIVNFFARTVFAHEALVRGVNGESAASILAKVTDANRYRFDQNCRIKAVEGAARLGIQEFVSINFMPNAVYQPEACIRSTFEAAQRYNFSKDRIIFEVIEGEDVSDRPHLINIFTEYRRFGFKTAIDDFGAGYAGLNLLAEFQPDVLKLDMDLVRDINLSKPKQAIVGGVVQICRELGIEVLAEGIETKAERDFLLGCGVTLFQGYLFCKPTFQAIGQINPDAWS